VDFNDRRPGKGQLDIFGGEHSEPPRDLRAGATAAMNRMGPGARTDRPVGLRGSISERLGLPGRLAIKAANRNAITSTTARYRDEDEDDGEPAPHPRTGLPSNGMLSTHYDIGFREGGTVPYWARFHTTVSSARRKNSTVKEIPIQDSQGPSIQTEQPTVSSKRMHEQMDHPETRSNPRLGHTELPHVYHDPFTGTHEMIDGNHRMSGALMRNEMFQPVHEITRENKDGLIADTKRIKQARRDSFDNPRVNPEAEKVLQRRYYGESY
jgi:hypothetical protein